MSKLSSINKDQELYVIESGEGFSCLGFDVCEKWTKAVLNWLGMKETILHPKGTTESYSDYLNVMALGEEHSRKTGQRCPALLIPEFIGHEGERVEVVDGDGQTRRFYIGKSTGWFPIHLEIKTKASSGGDGCLQDWYKSIKFLGSKKTR